MIYCGYLRLYSSQPDIPLHGGVISLFLMSTLAQSSSNISTNMLPVLLISGIISISLVPISVSSQIIWERPDAPLRGKLEMNRCTEDVPSAFRIPLSLRYAYGSSKKLENLERALGAPLYEFSLVLKEPHCGSDTFGATVPLANYAVPVVREGGLGGTPDVLQLNFTGDGSVVYLVNSTVELLYHIDNFCVARLTNETISLNLCKSKCYARAEEKGKSLCIPRCCAVGAISQGHGPKIEESCVQSDGPDWTPKVYTSLEAEVPEPEVHPQFLVNDVYTQEQGTAYIDKIYDTSSVRILSDGRIFLQNPESLQWKEEFSGNMPYSFCVDGYWNQSKTKVYEGDSSILLRRYRSQQEVEKELEERRLWAEALALRTQISIGLNYIPCAIIYLATLVIYLSIWDKHHTHGWTVVAFTTSQFLTYVVLITALSSFVIGNHAEAFRGKMNGICVTFGILLHFFSISTYSWTVVMTFDVWATLSSIRPESSKSTGKRLTCYSGFGIGIPFLVVLIATIIEFASNDGSRVIAPGYRRGCRVEGGKPYMLYTGVAYIVLFTFNVVFACLTFRSLWNDGADAKKLTTSKKKSTFGNKSILIAKLMFVMGFSLVFEFFLNFGGLTTYSQYFALLDFYRLLQAIGLFWTFVCGARTQEHLREKFPTFYKKVFTRRRSSYENVTGVTMDTKTH